MKIAVMTSCSKKKTLLPCGPANQIYAGQLVKMVEKYSKMISADLYIISGKYGLIHSNDEIENYDMKLNKKQLNLLQTQITNKFKQILSDYDEIILIMGKFYRSSLKEFLSNKKIKVVNDDRGIGGYYQKVAELISQVRLSKNLIQSQLAEA